MKPSHAPFRVLILQLAGVMLAAMVSACASLPNVDNLSELSNRKATPTVTLAKGKLPSRQTAELLARRWAKASPDLKALAALEEAATGVPLIAGNRVTLLFDGPATMKEMMAAAS
ncbi:MAG: cardiolipin synthase B, partial [Gammaproteobacteria bacterium]